MSVAKKEWYRQAAGTGGKLFSRSWAGENPRAVLVIAHGMAEHSARYGPFASYLAENGYAVYMNDHAGHGKSAQVKGHFADKDGWENVVTDLKTLMDEAAGEHPQLPLFLMGHSMGSFLSRSFLTRYGEQLSGCVLCGTMGINPAAGAGRAIAALQCRVLGPRSRGKLLNKIAFGSFNKRIEHPVNDFAWLSADEENCKTYAADPDCGFEFTAAGYRDLFTGVQEISSEKWAAAVPRNVPVFLIAGAEDPVGNYGKGPAQVADMLKAAGVSQVELKLYPGLRHEILNEQGKEQVYEDVLAWLNARL